MPGSKKRESGKILAVRARLPKSEQATLVPCPACAGSGHVTVGDRTTHLYRVVGCRWCSGSGSVLHTIVQLFHRWTRIRAYNVARGACVE